MATQISAEEQSASTEPRGTPHHDTDRLILSYLPLVKSIASRVYASLPSPTLVDLNDLVQAGVVGLTHAARNYKPEMEVSFSLYARYRVRGEILDSLRRLDLASRDLRRWQKQVSAATHDLAASLQRQPTDEELCQRLDVDISEMREKRAALLHAGMLRSGGYPASRETEDGDYPGMEVPGDPANRPDSICSRRQVRHLLEKAAGTLPKRYQEVISLYYSGEMTMKEIGNRLSINESRVSQIHKGALQSMARTLRSSGICSSADL